MRKYIALLIVFCACLVSFKGSAEAHLLATSGDVGAVLHIDPEDNPVAGEPTHFFFSMKDTSSRFSVNGCSCSFVVKANGKELVRDRLGASSVLNTQEIGTSYTFPARNVYQVILEGQPLATDGFQPFTLTFDVRVDQGTTVGALTTTSSKNPFLVLATVVVVLSYPIAYAYRVLKKDGLLND